MAGGFTPDYEGIGEMLRAPWMQAEMHRRATAGKEYAEVAAPFDARDSDQAHYRDLFRVEDTPRKDRASATLINDDNASFQIEHGTSDTPAHHTLVRALDVMGA